MNGDAGVGLNRRPPSISFVPDERVVFRSANLNDTSLIETSLCDVAAV